MRLLALAATANLDKPLAFDEFFFPSFGSNNIFAIALLNPIYIICYILIRRLVISMSVYELVYKELVRIYIWLVNFVSEREILELELWTYGMYVHLLTVFWTCGQSS